MTSSLLDASEAIQHAIFTPTPNIHWYRGQNSSQDWLFPPSHSYMAGWTTSAYVNLPHVARVDLMDKPLGVHKVSSRMMHPVVSAPNATSSRQQAWEAFYPHGSINPAGAIPGGFGFYMSGPQEFKERLQTATEVIIGYSVLFEEGWDWAKGGKLPGACKSIIRGKGMLKNGFNTPTGPF